MAKKLSSQSSGQGQEVQTTTSAFAQTVCEARKRAGQSQLQLARIAGVSPKTVAKIEETGIARFDAIVRLAKALGQPVNDWMVQSGHHVPRAKLEDILAQDRAQQIESPFSQLTPDAYMERTFRRLEEYQIGLRCVCVTAPMFLSTPAILDHVKKVINARLHFAMVSPFPVSSERFKNRYPELLAYYTSVYNWAFQAANHIKEHIPAARGRVHFFAPKVQDDRSLIPVYPPVRVSEIRPVLTQYGYQDPKEPHRENKRLIEFGTYFHFLDHRPDHWVDVCSDENATPRGIETRDMWQAYFRDILEAWTPPPQGKTTDTEYNFKESTFWELVKS